MTGEQNLAKLIRSMNPQLNEGVYVFASLPDLTGIKRKDTLFEFKEQEGITVVLSIEKAKEYNIPINYKAAWITLKIHSSLEAVGLTAAFSSELSKHNISCNVVAGYYHDHIFVAHEDANRSINVLKSLAEEHQI